MSRSSLIWRPRLASRLAKWVLYNVAQRLFVIAGVGVCVMGTITVVTVFSRKAAVTGPWLMSGLEIVTFLLAMITALAAAAVWYKRGHIRVGIIRDRRGPRAQAIMDIVSTVLFLVWVVAIAWGILDVGITNYVINERTLTSEIPIGPFQIVFAVLMVHFAFVLLRSVWGFSVKATGRDVPHEGLY